VNRRLCLPDPVPRTPAWTLTMSERRRPPQQLEIASVPALQRAVERVCSSGTTALTLDLRGLTFIDSTGLAAIVLANKICETNGYEFTLIRGADSTQRLFELTGLIDVLPFRDGADGKDSRGEPE
jgi:anti-sigma B factor antagonist